MENQQYNGAERRALSDGNDKLILFRLDKMDKAVDDIEKKTNAIALELVGLKSDIVHTAKESGKSSGTLSSIGIGVVMIIISLVIQELRK